MSEIKTEKQAVDLRAKAQEQAEAHTRTALALAETLFAIKFSAVKIGGKETPLVELWGFKADEHGGAFHNYCENELGMHGTTAERYVHVHDVLILSEGQKPADLPKSITKLVQLSRVAKRPGIRLQSWIKRAMELSCCDFESAVEEELTGKPSHRNWAFWMSNKDIRSIEKGIRRAKEILGTKHNGETLAHIVEEWSAIAESNALRTVRKAS